MRDDRQHACLCNCEIGPPFNKNYCMTPTSERLFDSAHEWEAEIGRRVSELEAGTAETIPWERARVIILGDVRSDLLDPLLSRANLDPCDPDEFLPLMAELLEDEDWSEPLGNTENSAS